MNVMSLKPGALVKLLKEKESSDDEISPRGSNSLLQVTGIVPALVEDELFPHRGFHLKVSDSSHSIYAALPQEQDDLILDNELQLGQFIHVRDLELSSPLPVLRGVKPLPGRHPCLGNPSDIDSGRFVKREKRLTHTSSAKEITRRRTIDSSSREILREMAKCRVEESEDSDSSRSSSAAAPSIQRTRSLRRSWNPSARVKDHRACGGMNPRRLIPRVVHQEERDWSSDCGENRVLGGEGSALPASLPLNLVKLGKEVMRRRDLAILAAVEALQEATSSEKLIHCLMKYPELQHHDVVDNVTDFLQEINQAKSAVQSLAKITHKTRNSTKIAEERRKHAIAWIAAALTSETLPETQSATISRICSSFSRSRHKSGGDAWMRGACPLAAADLAKSLQTECNRWFLTYIEKFLDGILAEKAAAASEHQIAGILLQIKKVDEWLEKTEASSVRDGYREASTESEKLEACKRVRSKIYSVLMKNVDRAASALESEAE